MGRTSSAWHEGRLAWARLTGWQAGRGAARSAHPGDGEAALTALADIGRLRILLEQAELVAVRTAREHRKSWAEIATQLGVTRQSAWEKWRELDLDDTASAVAYERSAPAPVAPAVPLEVAERAAMDARRKAVVVVPDVVGMSWDDARVALHAAGLVAVGPDPDGPPLAALGWPSGVVTDQSPESGAKVPRGNPVTVWIGGRGGSAGVREPRRPSPSPRSAREAAWEPVDEALG